MCHVILSDKTLQIITEAFQQNFELYGEIGASLSIWQHGEEALQLGSGWKDKSQSSIWDTETLIPVYSATKGPASATMLMVLEKHGLSPDSIVKDIWAEFPVEGATIAQLMSHQCGLPALDMEVSVFDYQGVIKAIENQKPAWQLGTAHGYHPRTYGFLLDELCLRLEGKKIGEVFASQIAAPLGLEFWIGLPEEQFPRVATLYSGKMTKSDMESGFYKAFSTTDSLVQKTFASPKGLQAVKEMNTPAAWQSGLPAMGGVSTASAIAKFYQAAIGEIPLFSAQVQQWMQQLITSGEDLVLCTPTAFSCGFQLDPLDSFGSKKRMNYGFSDRAFGHPGAGGSHGFGDPDAGISFAYTMNQMEIAVLPNRKSLHLIEALYS